MKTLVIIASAVLFACSTATWQRDRTTIAQAQADEKECRYEAIKANPRNDLGRELELLHRCMEIKGYVYR